MASGHWLMKSEPTTFGIGHLAKAKGKTTRWDGIRNYQARNLLRDEVKQGDLVLFWHSSADPTGVAGTCEVVRAAYPDPTQFDASSDGHDPGSKRDDPRWFCVDVRLVTQFPRVVSVDEIRARKELAEMDVLRRGNRLSVQRVTPEEFAAVVAMAGAK